MSQMVLWTVLFFVALAADFVTTRMGVLRGIVERNKVIAKDPMMLMAIFSVLIIGPAEACRQVGELGWTLGLYRSGAVVHALAAAWNTYQLMRSK